MMYAKVIDGEILEYKDLPNLDAIPPHKRHWFRPVVEEKPLRTQLEKLVGPTVTIEPDRVVKSWVTERRPVEDQKQQVKDECQRRILMLLAVSDIIPCIIKQLNALMRSVKLTDVKHVRELTPQEAAEASALESLSIKIEQLRAKSNALEAMTPIPIDYTDDKWWIA